MTRLAIIDGLRTPFGKAGTAFKSLSAQELGRLATVELLARTKFDPARLSHVIFGNVNQLPDAANIARVIALNAGIPHDVPAYTVHRNCASGLEAVTSAYEKMVAGQGDTFLVGGTESMSNIPMFYAGATADKFTTLSRAKTFSEKLRARLAFRPRDFKPRLGVLLGLTDPTCSLSMGQTAEVLSRDHGITREQQDQFALASHQKAEQSRAKLREEILPVNSLQDDNGVRNGQTIAALAKLPPIFDRKAGTVTAGNASQLTDGAVALLAMSEDQARQLGLKPLGYLRAYAYTGVEPRRMGIGPAYAIPAVLARAGMKLEDIGLVEINEAFAVQVLACEALLKKQFGLTLNRDILNVNGGAIALGHPVGASGARLVLTLLKEMQRRNVRTGLASACVGGGQGGALIVERD